MSKRPPKYVLHKGTGQARVRIDGRSHDPGPYDSPESHRRYRLLVADWLDLCDERRTRHFTVDEVTLAYLAHADRDYSKNGEPTERRRVCERGLQSRRVLIGGLSPDYAGEWSV